MRICFYSTLVVLWLESYHKSQITLAATIRSGGDTIVGLNSYLNILII